MLVDFRRGRFGRGREGLGRRLGECGGSGKEKAYRRLQRWRLIEYGAQVVKGGYVGTPSRRWGLNLSSRVANGDVEMS